MSKAGREVIFKFFAQSISIYCMSYFILPTTFRDEIQKMLNTFWWGPTEWEMNKLVKMGEDGYEKVIWWHGFPTYVLI